ncbi:MAG: cupin domain-containing protein [Clostridiales bacterium]|nr:cupin domain-containing protein [Clostridiales bacterium]
MIEQVFHYATGDAKTVEQVVKDDALHLNHIVLPKGESFPRHTANATVYMAVLRGVLTIELGEHGPREYRRGDVLQIPEGTVMQGFNHRDETLELWIVKLFAR